MARACAVAWGLALPAVHAGDWRVTPTFSLGETWTDNVFLAPTDEQTDYITSVTPGMSIEGEGRRLQLDAYYRLQWLNHLNESELNDITHFLQADARSELVEDFFFFDAYAAMFPAVESTFGRLSNRRSLTGGRGIRDPRFDRERGLSNRADVISYGFEPHIRTRLGSWATVTGSISYNDTVTDSTRGGASGIDYRAGIASGRRFQRFRWYANYSQRGNNFDSGEQSASFGRLTFGGSYKVNRLLSIDGSVGTENNSFRGDRNQDGGPTWSLGGTLTPSRRTRLSGDFGERSFGSTKSFTFSHTRRRFVINGSYREELRTSAELLREQRLFRRVDEFGNPVDDPLFPEDPLLPTEDLGLTDDVFVSRYLSVDVGYRRKRDYLSLRVFRDEQESQSQRERGPGSETATGTSGSWTRTLSRRMSVGVNAAYQQREGDAASNSEDLVFLTPFFSYIIGPHVRSNVSYSYSEAISDDPQNEYVENSVRGTLSVAF